MMKRILLLALTCYCALHAYAQDAKEIKKLLREGDKYMAALDFHAAYEQYAQVLAAEPNHLDANLKAGLCYQHSLYRDSSLVFLRRILKTNPTYESNLHEVFEFNPKYHEPFVYLLAKALHWNNLFREAERQYEKSRWYYRNLLNDTEKDLKKEIRQICEEKVKEIEKKIKQCKLGEQYIAAPVNAQILNLGKVVNGKFDEYAPVVTADESVLVFTSRREGTVGGNRDKLDGKFYEDIYLSRGQSGRWGKPDNIGSPVNSKYHDACIAISADGKQIFIYQDNNKGTGDIYVSRFEQESGEWSAPKSLGKNINTEHHETSITITPDGNTVYFASNRPGGAGGLDIYRSQRDAKGDWGEAVNLGASINTEYDDDAPFISFNWQHLYFSSEGHSSMGGYDIFKSTLQKDGTWGKPENLGYPINTADNDIFFVLSADERTGYYASSKMGGFGQNDLYEVRMPFPVPNDIPRPPLVLRIPPFQPNALKVGELPEPRLTMRGTVRDKLTKQVIAEARIDINVLRNGARVEQMRSAIPAGTYGSTKLQWENVYLLTAEKEGYLFNSKAFDTPPKGYEDREVVVDIELEPLRVGAKIDLVIFYDFDKATLRRESITELNRLLAFLKKYPQVSVEIAGHTDAIGTEQKNQILSDQRAKSVVDFLLENGIAEDRLRHVGYGELKPIAPNNKPDGKDDPEGRQRNRRTECIVTAVK